MDTQAQLLKALALFSDVTGVTPGQSSYSVNMSGRFSSYDAKKAFDKIKENMDLDPTLTTAVFLLRNVYEKYMRDTTLSLRHIVDSAHKGSLLMRFNKNARLDKLIYSGILADVYSKARQRIGKVLTHYERDGDAFTTFMDDIELLTDVLVQAAGAEKQLDLRQYSSGPDDPAKPRVVEAIIEFKSIEEAVGYAGSTGANFIAVGYVPDRTNELWSYFFFLIKRGGNIYTASDAVKFIHPQQKQMFNSRRGGIRAFESQKPPCYQFFPYEIINNFVERETEGAYTANKEIKAVVSASKESRIKAMFACIRSSSLVWMNLVADRLHTKLFSEDVYVLDELTGFTCTAPELQTTEELVPYSAGVVVPWSAMRIDLEPFKEQDISFEATADLYDNKLRGINWRLEERYLPQVQADVMLPHEAYVPSTALTTRGTDPDQWKAGLVPYAQDCCTGTTAELLRARKQVARLNAKAAIKQLALAEYQENASACVEAIVDLINSNRALLFNYMISAREQVTVTRRTADYFPENKEEYDHTFSNNDSRTIFSYAGGHKYWWNCAAPDGKRVRDSRYRGRLDVLSNYAQAQLESISAADCHNSTFTCPWQHTAATRHYHVVFHYLQDLQFMGFDTAGLPEVLQALWHPTDGRYVGNSILSNMDPMDDDLYRELNPWAKFGIAFAFHCSAAAQTKLEAGKISDFPCDFKAVKTQKWALTNPYGLSNMCNVRRWT